MLARFCTGFNADVCLSNDNGDPMSLQTGWMMWNWMVSVLAVGGAIVLYDGSPLVPHVNILWDIVDNVG